MNTEFVFAVIEKGKFAETLGRMLWKAYGPAVHWLFWLGVVIVCLAPLVAFLKKMIR